MIFLLLFANAVLSQTRYIHVFVPLCDNKYQGIVPVPAKIGNGQDLKNNLYWGCGYGVKMFFKLKSPQWKLVHSVLNPKNKVLERCVFKHTTLDVYLVADAYDGQYIKECTLDYLDALNGSKNDSIAFEGKQIYCGSKATLICYTGHDGLMDFENTNTYTPKDKIKRDAIILACFSKSYFSPFLKQIGANPLVWSTHLMSPEAYTLEAAVNAWVAKKSNVEAREAAAAAYSKYQKTCSINSARRLLVTGF